jgi:hypothetical protein
MTPLDRILSRWEASRMGNKLKEDQREGGRGAASYLLLFS